MAQSESCTHCPCFTFAPKVDIPELRAVFAFGQFKALHDEHGEFKPLIHGPPTADVERDREDCEAVLSRLQERVKGLKKHLEKIETYQSHLRRTPHSESLIQQLPDELLLTIFSHVDTTITAFPYDADSPRRTPRMHPPPALMTLSGVCSKWRQTLQSDPRFWSRFSIIGVPGWDAYHPLGPVVDHFCQLAATEPLELTIDANAVNPINPVMRRILVEASRWRSITFHDPSGSNTRFDDNLRLFMTLSQVQFGSSLTSLSLQGIWFSDKNVASILIFSPHLIEFSLSDPREPETPSAPATLRSAITSDLIQSFHTQRPSPIPSLLPSPSIQPILPSLRSLKLESSLSSVGSSGSFNHAAFVDMVISRSSGIANTDVLQSVTLILPRAEVPERTIYRPLLPLKDATGMQLDIRIGSITEFLESVDPASDGTVD